MSAQNNGNYSSVQAARLSKGAAGPSTSVNATIMSFNTPSITPSNINIVKSPNVRARAQFKQVATNLNLETSNLAKSHIQGRKMDSPLLRVVREDSHLQIGASSSNVSDKESTGHFRRDDWFIGAKSALNQTDKQQLARKQFDFNLPRAGDKTNVTIQYDSTTPVPTRAKAKPAINQSATRKSRGSSMPRTSAVGQLSAPSASQAKPVKKVQTSAALQGPKKKLELKFASNQPNQNPSNHPQSIPLSKHKKHKSTYEQKPNERTLKLASAAHTAGNSAVKRAPIHAKKNSMKVPPPNFGVHHQVEDKENTSAGLNFGRPKTQHQNNRELTPPKPGHSRMGTNKHNNALDLSISSVQSSGQKNKAGYFLDKSSILANFSPDKVDKSKTNVVAGISGNESFLLSNKVMSLDAGEATGGMTEQDKKQHDYKQLRAKRATPTSAGPFTKGKMPQPSQSALDRIMKENLKKQKKKEEVEIMKKYLQDYKQKQKKAELSQRNQEVRKINASRIIEKSTAIVDQSANQSRLYRKQRSKSCMNKTDNIFSNLSKKNGAFFENAALAGNQTKKRREKSFVLEMKELKKEIDEEIRREQKTKKLDLSHHDYKLGKRTNLSTLSANPIRKLPDYTMKEERTELSVPRDLNNARSHSASRPQAQPKFYFAKGQPNKRPKQASNITVQNKKIQKFMDRKKKENIAKKSLEHTIEAEKHQKIQENLNQLNDFVKHHFRQQSQPIKKKEIVLSKDLLPKKKLRKQFGSGTHFPRRHLNQSHTEFEGNMKNETNIFDKDLLRMTDDALGEPKKSSSTSRHGSAKKKGRKGDDSQEFYDAYIKVISSIHKHTKNHDEKKKVKHFKTKSTGSQKRNSPSKSGKQPKTRSKMGVYIPHAKGRSQIETPSEHYPVRRVLEAVDQTPSTIKGKSPPSTVIRQNGGKPGQDTSLYPPSSDHYTLDHKRGDSNSKSPSNIEHKRKVNMLVNRYDRQRQTSDTKLLIKLHSAAITIQQNWRNFLNRGNFYDHLEPESDMYINSDFDQPLNFSGTASPSYINSTNKQKKLPLTPLEAMVPEQDEDTGNEERKSEGFYPSDSDLEKVVHCSVISSGRPENEDSLSNTQKYIPLRTKSKHQSGGGMPPSHQPQTSSKEFVLQSSAASSAPRTAIKSHIPAKPPTTQKEDSSKSQRKQDKKVPTLDLNKVHVDPIKLDGESKPQPSAQSVFERHSFQEYFDAKGDKVRMDPAELAPMYEEVIRMREEAIQYRQQTETKYMNKMLRQKQFSPRTYDIKRKELETWVSKERDEIKKTKHVFEEQWKKTTSIIEQTQKDAEAMKKILMDSDRFSNRDNLLSSRRGPSEHVPMPKPAHENVLNLIYEDEPKTNIDEVPFIVAQSAPIKQADEQHTRSDSAEIAKARLVEAKQLEEQAKQKKHEWAEKEKVMQQKLDALSNKFSKPVEPAEKDILQIYPDQPGETDPFEPKPQEEPDLLSEPELFGSDIKKSEDQLLKGILDSGPAGRNSPDKNQSPQKESPFRHRRQEPLISSHLVPETVEEPVRGLSRTRSSQYLKDGSPEEGSPVSHTELRQDEKYNLGQNSVDEEKEDLGPIRKENFFTQNYDEENTVDVLEKIKQSSDPLAETLKKEDASFKLSGDTPSPNREVQPKINNFLGQDPDKQSKIYIEDKGHEVEPEFADVAYDTNKRLPSKFAQSIPVEQEEETKSSTNHPIQGVPVSPNNELATNVPTTSPHDIRIQTGSQSLESTLSGEGADSKKLKTAISDANKQIEQDKIVDEITNELFGSLVQEVKFDLDMLVERDPRKLFKEDTNASSPGNERPQNQQQQFLSESGRFLIFDRKGIKTDLFAIERYVDEVLEEVARDLNAFNTAVNNPIKKIPLDVLNQLQTSEIGSYEHFEQIFPPVLPLDMYLRLEKRRKEKREREKADPTVPAAPSEDNFLAECEHIHNKVLFDCINDSLQQFKPYGKDAEPLPWSRTNRRLKPTEDFKVEEMFEIVKHDLFRWAITQAGTLPRKEFVFEGVFDDELFAEIREKKLATLLAREMIETEPKWLTYEFEEAQVKIDIGDMILEQLVTESIKLLNNPGLAKATPAELLAA